MQQQCGGGRGGYEHSQYSLTVTKHKHPGIDLGKLVDIANGSDAADQREGRRRRKPRAAWERPKGEKNAAAVAAQAQLPHCPGLPAEIPILE